MKITNLGGARTVNSYVRNKLKDFERSEKNFETLFRLMFSESANTFTESYRGFKVVRTTYGEARENSVLLAKAIEKRLPELTSGDRPVCGIYMENSLLWIEVFWALVISGVRPLLMNLLLDTGSLKKAALYAGCSHIICDEGKVSSLSEEFKEFKVAGAGELDSLKESFRGAEKADGPSKPFAEEIIFMTSGTTGNVKLCFYGAENLFYQVAYAYNIITTNGRAKKHYKGDLRQLAFLPFYHIFGFVAVYLYFGFFSRSFVFLKDLSPETLTNTVRRRHVTHIFAVPLFWNKVYEGAMRQINSMGPGTVKRFEKGLKIAELLYKIPLAGTALGRAFSKFAFKPVRRKLFGESVYFCISGGGQIRSDVLRFFNLIGYVLVNGFGMTETGVTSVELSKRIPTVLKGLVGHPLATVTYKVEKGELYVKSRIMANHIVENGVDRTLPEWFPTRDMAEPVKNGFRILGRADDLIVPESGENINPDIAEKSIDVKGVLDLCILSYKGGAGIVASVAGNTDGKTAERIREDIAAASLKTNLRGSVTAIILTKDPLIPPGDFKVSRKKLLARLDSGDIKDIGSDDEEILNYKDAPESSVSEKDELLDEIRRIIADHTGRDASAIRPESDLFVDIGITSLDYFAIISDISGKYGCTMPVSFSEGPVTPLSLRNEAAGIIGGKGGA